MKNNPIPPDQTSWSVYGKLYQDNLGFLRQILEQAATEKNRDAVTQKIGDFYGSCMNETLVEKLGAKPMQPDLDAIQGVKNTKQLAPLMGQLQIQGIGALFDFGPTQDPDDSDKMIVGIDQGGLGLPDRDYYLKDDDKSKETRAKYLEHVQKMFELLGDSPDVARKNAATVMRMETSLAKASLSRVDRRDPYKLKHKMTVPELYKVAPDFDWNAFFTAAGVPKFEILNVAWPDFFKDVNAQLGSAPLADWQTYLRWHVAHSRAAFLSSRIRRCELRVLPQVSAGGHGTSAALEAVRAIHRQQSGRRSGTSVCAGDVWSGPEGVDGADDATDRGRDGGPDSAARLDESDDQTTGAGEAEGHPQ